VPGESEHSSTKSRGPFTWSPKYKMAIFFKVTLMILIKFQPFMETVSLFETEQKGIFRKIKILALGTHTQNVSVFQSGFTGWTD
jgi:hypothetical protein